MEKLIYNKPGVMICIEYPYNPEGNIINFAKSLKTLAKKELLSQQASSSPTNQDNTNENKIDESKFSKPKNNYYDNFIDRLEMKYRGQVVQQQDNDDEDGTHSDSESTKDESIDEPNASDKPVTKRRTRQHDAYDHEDPLIDDSDMVAQVNTELQSKKFKTHYDGFFVSTGNLDVEKAPVKRQPSTESVKTSAKDKAATSSYSSSSSSTTPASHLPAPTTAPTATADVSMAPVVTNTSETSSEIPAKPRKKRVRIADPPAAPSSSSAPASEVNTTPTTSATSVPAADKEKEEPSKDKPVKPKAVWKATADDLRAVEVFRQEVLEPYYPRMYIILYYIYYLFLIYMIHNSGIGGESQCQGHCRHVSL